MDVHSTLSVSAKNWKQPRCTSIGEKTVVDLDGDKMKYAMESQKDKEEH